MSNFFKDCITVYHFDDDNVSIINCYNVYFRHNKKSNLIDKGLEKGSTGSITIPTNYQIGFSTGDYVVEGIRNDEFNERDLREKYQLFKIVSVDDNRKGKLPHFKIGVSE